MPSESSTPTTDLQPTSTSPAPQVSSSSAGPAWLPSALTTASSTLLAALGLWKVAGFLPSALALLVRETPVLNFNGIAFDSPYSVYCAFELESMTIVGTSAAPCMCIDTMTGYSVRNVAFTYGKRGFVSLGSLVGKFSLCQFLHNDVHFVADRSTNGGYSNVIKFDTCKFNWANQWAGQLLAGQHIVLDGCDVEMNVGGFQLAAGFEAEVGYSSATWKNGWFEGHAIDTQLFSIECNNTHVVLDTCFVNSGGNLVVPAQTSGNWVSLRNVYRGASYGLKVQVYSENGHTSAKDCRLHQWLVNGPRDAQRVIAGDAIIDCTQSSDGFVGQRRLAVTTTPARIARLDFTHGLIFVSGYNGANGLQGWWIFAIGSGQASESVAKSNGTGLPDPVVSCSNGYLYVATQSGTMVLNATALQ